MMWGGIMSIITPLKTQEMPFWKPSFSGSIFAFGVYSVYSVILIPLDAFPPGGQVFVRWLVETGRSGPSPQKPRKLPQIHLPNLILATSFMSRRVSLPDLPPLYVELATQNTSDTCEVSMNATSVRDRINEEANLPKLRKAITCSLAITKFPAWRRLKTTVDGCCCCCCCCRCCGGGGGGGLFFRVKA